MKNLIILIQLILFSLNILGQNNINYQSPNSFTNKINSNFLSSDKYQPVTFHTVYLKDSLWLYGRSDMYIWENNEYIPFSISGLYEYYDNPEEAWFGKTKTYTGFIEPNDSTHKLHFFYYTNSKDSALIYQKYDTTSNIWKNYSLTKHYYDVYGYDSCISYYLWDNSDSLWINNQREQFHRNTKKAITEDVISVWSGTDWQIVDGHKFTYFDNSESSCTDSIYLYDWDYETNYWKMNHKWFLYYDENNVQTSGLDVFFDPYLNEWRNFQRSLEYEFDNWCGCEKQWITDSKPTHFILQNWDDTAWFNIERANSIYDSLGGEITILEFPDSLGNWILGEKLEVKYFDTLVPEFWLISIWKDNKWIGDNGQQFKYIYDENKLIERYRNIWYPDSNNWGPKWKDVFSNYILLLNINKIESINTSSLLQIIPNPSKTSILIKLNDEGDRIKTVKVFDISGREIFGKKSDTAYNLRLNISSFKKGTYIINVETRKGKNLRDKFIKN